MYEQLEELARARGGAVFAVADVAGLRRDYPEEFRLCPGDYPRGVVVGVRLSAAVLEGIVDRPTPLYFHHYRQVNYLLDRIALELAAMLQSGGHRALAIPASQVVERDPPRGHLSHKLLGWQAGLGWRGRNNLLVNPEFGSELRYVSILTDADLPCGVPPEGDCGNCRACVGVCPAEAIREDPLKFDLEACYAKLCEFAKIPYIGQHICGVCVKACSPDAVAAVAR